MASLSKCLPITVQGLFTLLGSATGTDLRQTIVSSPW